MYVSAHPLAGLKKVLAKKFELAGKLTAKDVGKTKTVGGIITGLRKMITKKTGQMMAFLVLEDPTGTIEVSLFPKVFAQFGNQIEKDELITATGRLEFRNDVFQVSAHEIKRVDLEKVRAKAESDGFLDDSTGRAAARVSLEEKELLPEPPLQARIFQITLPDSADADLLQKLKSLLVGAKSESGSGVDILIPDGPKKMKRIKVPFKVGVGETLVAEIQQLTEGIQVS
jgi:DNA polymerase III alpha subunit